MVILTCLNGSFAKPNGSRFLADEIHLSDGAVAAFASTSVNNTQVKKPKHMDFMELIFLELSLPTSPPFSRLSRLNNRSMEHQNLAR
jgi:hypothetical protein